MRELTFVEAAREGLAEEMARDPRVFVVGQGIGERGGNFNTTLGLYDLYGPERKNAAGLDLNDPTTLTALREGLAAALRRPWRAAPIIAGLEQTGTNPMHGPQPAGSGCAPAASRVCQSPRASASCCSTCEAAAI